MTLSIAYLMYLYRLSRVHRRPRRGATDTVHAEDRHVKQWVVRQVMQTVFTPTNA